MKKLFCLILALLLLTGCGASQTEEEPTVEEAPPAVEETPVEEAPPAAEEAPAEEEALSLGSFTAQSLTGETVDQSIFANADLTVINIWATYCGPCKVEMPVLGQIHRDMENVQVLGIVTDVIDQNAQPDESQVALALDLLEAADCDYVNLILNQDLANLGFASLQAVPATLFVDRDGNLVGQGFYGALDEEGWNAAIAERLEMAQK